MFYPILDEYPPNCIYRSLSSTYTLTYLVLLKMFVVIVHEITRGNVQSGVFALETSLVQALDDVFSDEVLP